MRHIVNDIWSFTLKGGDTFGTIYYNNEKFCTFQHIAGYVSISKPAAAPKHVYNAIETTIKHGEWKSQIKIAMNENSGNPVPIEKLAGRLTEDQVKELTDKYPDHIKFQHGKVRM